MKVSKEDIDLKNNFPWSVVVDGKVDGLTYAQSCINGKASKTHRIIMERIIRRKLKKSEQVDHINGDGLDNRRENLRIATHSQNQHNSRLRKDNTSGYKGVSWNKLAKKWSSQIKFCGKSYCLGFFAEKKDAAKKYNEVAIKKFGVFANLNKITNN